MDGVSLPRLVLRLDVAGVLIVHRIGKVVVGRRMVFRLGHMMVDGCRNVLCVMVDGGVVQFDGGCDGQQGEQSNVLVGMVRDE